MIRVRSASKRFGPARALDRIDLEVARGERVAIFGPNGAGKTTLLRLIAGLHRPDSGTVTVDSADPREVRAMIGYLGHEPQLYPQLTVEENLLFCARLYGLGNSAAAAMLRTAGIESKKDRLTSTLSRGELQRVSIAKTLLHDPDLVLADEPFNALDEQSIATLPDLLLRNGRTIVLATHEKERAAPIVGRVVSIESGRIAGR